MSQLLSILFAVSFAFSANAQFGKSIAFKAATSQRAPVSGGGGSFPNGSIIDLKLNGDVTDSSGNGNNASVTGTSVFTTGQDGAASHAFSFNGSTTADLADGTVANFTSSNFSISFWVKFNTGNLATTPAVISKGFYNLTGYYIFFNSVGVCEVDISQNGAIQTIKTASGAFSEGAWYHVVFVRSGTSGKIYKNGSDATSSSDAIVNPDEDSTHPIRIGGYTGGGSNFNGTLDEVSIWSTALTSVEVGNIYSENAR